MTTQTEALKMALEALDMMVMPRSFQAQVRIKDIYDTIKEALAQPEQERGEPYGYLYEGIESHTRGKTVFNKTPEQRLETRWWREVGPVYTTPPHRKPLTDEEILELLMPVRITGDGYFLRIARAIEAAHGIKE